MGRLSVDQYAADISAKFCLTASVILNSSLTRRSVSNRGVRSTNTAFRLTESIINPAEPSAREKIPNEKSRFSIDYMERGLESD